MGTGLRSATAVADRLWLGLANGDLCVFEAGPKPKLLAHWDAHDSAVVSITQVDSLPIALHLVVESSKQMSQASS